MGKIQFFVHIPDINSRDLECNKHIVEDAATVATNQAVKAGSKKGKNEKLESKPISSAKVTEVKKQTKLGLDVKKEENTADWYSQARKSLFHSGLISKG